MITQNCRRSVIATCVAIAIFSTYSMVVLATTAAKFGALIVSGIVTVDGQNVVSGTVFSDNLIVTADESKAVINISELGRIDLAPNSALKLNFTQNDVNGILASGSARVSTLPGMSVSFKTSDGVVNADGREATSFTVNVIDGVTSLTTHSGYAELRVVGSRVKEVQNGEAAMAMVPQAPSSGGGFPGGALAALLLAAGGAVAAAILWANRNNNDL